MSVYLHVVSTVGWLAIGVVFVFLFVAAIGVYLVLRMRDRAMKPHPGFTFWLFSVSLEDSYRNQPYIILWVNVDRTKYVMKCEFISFYLNCLEVSF